MTRRKRRLDDTSMAAERLGIVTRDRDNGLTLGWSEGGTTTRRGPLTDEERAAAVSICDIAIRLITGPPEAAAAAALVLAECGLLR